MTFPEPDSIRDKSHEVPRRSGRGGGFCVSEGCVQEDRRPIAMKTSWRRKDDGFMVVNNSDEGYVK
jgi:hypothetical protein